MPLMAGREYRKYLAASILTSVGSGMQFVAIAWFLYKLTGTSASIGWMLIVATVPGMLFSPWIGALVDRWDARRICIATDLLRAVIFCGLAGAMQAGVSNVALIYACAFLVAICDNFFQPAVGAMVRDVVPREVLLKANVGANISMQVGLLSGAGVGGMLVAQVGPANVVLINALSFIVSAGFTYWIHSATRAGGAGASEASGRKTGLLNEFGEAIRYMTAHGQIVWLAILQMFVYLTLYICNTLLPAFVDRQLKSDAAGFGLVDAAWGAGAICGGLSLGFIVKRMDRRRFGLAGLLFLSVAMLVFATSSAVPQAVLGFAMLGFMTCTIRVNTDTIIVTDVDPRYFAKVKAAITMFISYMGVAVYALVGFLGDRVSGQVIFLVLAMWIFSGFVAANLPRIGMRRQLAS